MGGMAAEEGNSPARGVFGSSSMETVRRRDMRSAQCPFGLSHVEMPQIAVPLT